MRSADIVRMARQRAGLTQRQLAERSGRPRETITRWETGVWDPSFAALDAVVAACGLDLVVHLANRDTSIDELVAEQLRVAPVERLRRLLPAESWRQSLDALCWLSQTRTQAILIGAVADVLQGAPQRPRGGEVEIVSNDPYAMEIAMRDAALTPLDRPERWSDVDRREPWMMPGGGTIVIAKTVPGTTGYKDLRRSAESIALDGEKAVAVAHPRDLLRLADASLRESERARAPALRVLLSQRYPGGLRP